MATAKKPEPATVAVSVKTLRAAEAALAGLVEEQGHLIPSSFAAGRVSLAQLRKIKGVSDGNA